MGRNPQRRQAKAIRRKNLLAERRRLGVADGKGTLAEEVRRAAAAALHSCLLQNEVFTCGVGMMILTRKIGARRVAMAGFLVDRYCLGVKDVLFREAEDDEIEAFLDGLAASGALFEPVDPSYARKFLRDAAAYARSLGLEPDADFAAVEPIFGDVAADACEVQFEFGFQGKPLYVPGPTESPTQIRRRLDRLHRQLGADGFVFGDIDESFDGLEEPFEEGDLEGGYDPAVAPDPKEWLSLGEQERLDMVSDYHRRAGDPLPSRETHAAIHVTIETQIALGDELPVRRAVDRLMAEGLDRHQAVHAVGSVLSSLLFETLNDHGARVFPKEAYNAAIERLTVESWRREWGSLTITKHEPQ